MPNLNKVSFAGGELKPSLHQRVDIAKYGVGAQKLLNYFVHASGGISNRAGFRYINRAKYADKNTRLINFEFNTEQAYALEFGDFYMRVLRNGGHVLEPNIDITGATQANPCVITAAAGHGYVAGDWVFIQSVGGMTEVNGSFYIVANPTSTTFEITNLDGTAIDSSAFTAYTSGGLVARVYEITTPYAHADLALIKITQSADVMTLAHPSYTPAELSRTGHASWFLSDIQVEPEIDIPENLAGSGDGSGTNYRYKVTAVAEETTEESLPAINGTAETITGATQANPVVITATNSYSDGDEVLIDNLVGMTELNGNRYIVQNVSGSSFELRGIDGTGFTAYDSGGTSNLTFVTINGNLSTSGNENTITWNAVPGAEKYNVYKEDNGIYGYIGSTENLSFTDDNIKATLDDTPPKSRNPFEGTDDKPGAVSLYEQRRVFGRTNNKRDTIYTSQTSNYSNFNVSSPAKPDDALTFTLAANQVNEIRHLLNLGDLIALTSGGEWRIAGADGQPLQPDTINAQRQSARGANHVPPIVIGNTAIYIQARGKKVRDLRYTIEADGYDGSDVSILSSHLMRKTRNVDKRIKEWCYQQEPDSIIWAVHNDGSMTSFTYEREHEVWAWAQHNTDGNFHSICCIPEDDLDRVYAVIERTIDGTTHKYIESMEAREVDEDDIINAFFVDSGITIEGNTGTEITGIDWLEGKTVSILGDGNEVAPQTVTDGAITLDDTYSTVTIGLPYVCDMQPLDIELDGGSNETSKGRLKKVNRVYMHVYQARQIKVAPKDPAGPLAPDEKVSFEQYKQREWEDYDEPVALKTGIIEIEVAADWQQRAAPFFRHDTPLPITILGITPQVDISE